MLVGVAYIDFIFKTSSHQRLGSAFDRICSVIMESDWIM